MTMLFNATKYTRWYFNIITRAKSRVLDNGVYCEKHHVIPKSLGGNDDYENLVKLTAREHFICHWLLTKMTTNVNQQKMAYACKMMMHSRGRGQERYRITSKIYETLKQKLNMILKDREFTEEWKNKLKVSAQRRAQSEGPKEKAIRRANRILGNKKRKGEKRPGQSGSNNHFYGKGFFGVDNPFYGKKHTEETLKKLRVPKSKIKCNHCGLLVGGESNYKRWHGNNCKSAVGEQIA